MVYKVLKNNIFFLLPYAITWLIIFPFLLIFSKSDIHLWLNRYQSPFFDWFFRNITFLGDGLFVLTAVILLLFHSLRSSVYLLATFIATGLFVQILKRFFFENCLRPIKYMQDVSQLHLVNGVPMLGGHSFPSGHAASAFALFLVLSVTVKNRYIQFVCFIIACLVAYSRVYLSQHFLVDIMFGSLIGILGTLAFYAIFYRNELKWHHWSIKKIILHEPPR